MKNKKILWSLLPIFILLGAFGLYRSDAFPKRKEPIYIVVTVPGLDISKAATERSINAIQLYLDEVNATSGGVNGHPLKLVQKIDGGNTAQAEKVANEIVQEKRALIVLGNGWSGPATAIGKVFAANQIPAMTAGATAPSVTEGNDWFFRVLNNNNSQGNFIAEYASALFGYKTATIIYEDNAYGQSLAEAFEAAFKTQHGEIIDSSPVREKSESLTEDVQVILQSYAEIPEMVFLATSKASGAAAVVNLRNEYPDIAIIGGDDLGDAKFVESVSEYLGGKGSANIMDGIYAASPLIFDIANDRAQKFRSDYLEKYGETPTWFTATSYDSALVAVEAMRKAGISGDQDKLVEDRQKLRDYLDTVDRAEEGFAGLTGDIYFDDNHNFVQPMAMGLFESQQFISAPIQLTAINSGAVTKDIYDGLKTGDVIRLGTQYAYKTQIVYVGIDINEFKDLDIDNGHAYLADFYLWFRYQGNLNFDEIAFDNSVGDTSLGEPLQEKAFGDMNYRLYHIRDTFTNNFDLRNYPFDKQQLKINLRHTALERHNLIFVVDLLGLGDVTTRTTILQSLDQARAFAAINDWKPINGYFHADSVHEYTTRGDPAQFGEKIDIEYSRFNAAIEIQRDAIRFTSKTMLPVLCIIALAYLGLFLPGKEFETVTGIMTGTVLSVVFFHVDLSGRLNVGYTVALDFAFYVIYALLAIELMISIIAWHRSVIEGDDGKFVRRLFWLMRTLYPIVLIGGAILMIINYDISLVAF